MAKDKKQNLTLKKAAMLEALEKSLGIVTSAAKSVGIRRETHYAWLNEDAEYKEKVNSLSDVALDFAESQLHKQIQNGEVSSTIFYLKTKGKKRGYIESQRIAFEDNDGNVDNTLKINIVRPNAG
jgi:hypothetical protein